MEEQEPKPVDPIAAQADRLEKALADLEARKRAAAEMAAKNAPQIERLKALEAKLEALPQQERREVLDALGIRQVSAAPKPISPLRGGGFVSAPKPQTMPPRWPMWLSLPSVELWQAVLLSLGVEPDDAFRKAAMGNQPTSHLQPRHLSGEFFQRRQDCFRALSDRGPIRPQSFYSGALRDPACPVLLADVSAFLSASGYAVPDELSPDAFVNKGPTIKRDALIAKYERAWTTIERDLRDGSSNGLSAAAKAEVHGMWFEAAALAWAERNGKYTPPEAMTRKKATPFDGLAD